MSAHYNYLFMYHMFWCDEIITTDICQMSSVYNGIPYTWKGSLYTEMEP